MLSEGNKLYLFLNYRWVLDYDRGGHTYIASASFVLNPTTAVNPLPEDEAADVSAHLEELRWDYVAENDYAIPAGFKVYLNKTGEFDYDDYYAWVDYVDGQTEYATSEIADALEYNTEYFWKVVPTTIEPERRGSDGERERRILAPLRSHISERGDAVDCPVWTFRTEAGVSVDEETARLITGLKQSYPNPFNPSTIISYSLAKNTDVELIVYNVRGQIVRTLVREFQPSGLHRVEWDGTDDSGKSMPSGLYFYRLRTDEYQKTEKMMLVK